MHNDRLAASSQAAFYLSVSLVLSKNNCVYTQKFLTKGCCRIVSRSLITQKQLCIRIALLFALDFSIISFIFALDFSKILSFFALDSRK